MNEHGITTENLQAALPSVLANDENLSALAAGVSEILAGRMEEIDSIRLYTRIDELPEALLDILAYDFKVDWWDADYSLEEKRATLRGSWRVHRQLGTKAAVETALSAIYPETKVQEWFEYGGNPYRFRLLIDASFENVDPAKHARVLERVAFYKNLRSAMDEIEYYDAGGSATAYTGVACVGEALTESAVAMLY